MVAFKKKKKISPVALMCEIGIMAAVGFVLDELAGAMFKGVFVNGGSIGIAMVAIILMCYRRGPLAGFVVGLIMGLFDLMTGPYMIAASPIKVFFQVGLDYVFAYPAVALGGIFKKAFDKAETKNKKTLFLIYGVIVGSVAKLACHYLAGVLFWADPSGFAWNLTSMNPYLYCFVYNVAFMGPSAVLSGVFAVILLQKAPQLYLLGSNMKVAETKKLSHVEYLGITLFGIGAILLFAFFLTGYIRSFSYEDYGEWGSELGFDSDMMVGWIMAFFLFVFCCICVLQGQKGKYKKGFFIRGLVFIGAVVIIYGLARYTRCLVKGSDPSSYYPWIGGGMLLSLFGVNYLLLTRE